MKKSNFLALVMGTVSGMLFALGMCMALLPEWNAFPQGIVLGCTGIVLGLITAAIWRKMEKKPPIRLSGRTVLASLVAIAGALLLGVGMCCVMVWEQLALGILVGLVGIVALLCLIPLLWGLK